ncbi:MAG: hypothetical protein HYX69_16945 [Planctomycetia bacterium]|nr:hypothetical protein [Planctomycetia bacterium]
MRILCAALMLAAAFCLRPGVAAGPLSRTAPVDAFQLAFPILGDVCPADLAEDAALESALEPAIRLPAIDAAPPLPTEESPAEESDDAAEPCDDEAESARTDKEDVEADTASAPGDEEADEEPTDEIDAPRPRPLSPRLTRLRARVRDTLGYYHGKHLNTRDHNPWEVMHSIVAYGAHSQLNRNGPGGETVNAISWLCWNGDCHGTRILEVTDGRVAARKGPYVQGHPGQFLAILAQGRIAKECPIKVDGKEFTLADLIESEKLGCRAKTELTFKLIGFSYYLDVDEHWKNSAGEDWSIDRLVHEELAQKIVGAPCGGTHRLMGLAYAVRKRESADLPVTGEFAKARKYLDNYHRYTLRLQNADGSFSTEWFKGPGDREDLQRRIQTSGHILEWLSYSVPEEMLRDPRVVKAVEYLSGVLQKGKKTEWEVGPLGHSLHALAIYDERVFKPLDRKAAPRNLASGGGPQRTGSKAKAESAVQRADSQPAAEMQLEQPPLRTGRRTRAAHP